MRGKEISIDNFSIENIRRNKGFTFSEILVVIVVIIILAAILFPTFNRGRGDNPRASACASNLKQMGLSALQYAHDYDFRFPPTSVVRSGFWAGSLQPYVRFWEIFQCPSTKFKKLKTTDYYLNSKAATKSQTVVDYPQFSILVGEGADDSAPNCALPSLPEKWRGDPTSPARRHFDRGNYLFVDGHVERYPPDKITNDSPNGHSVTFDLMALK